MSDFNYARQRALEINHDVQTGKLTLKQGKESFAELERHESQNEIFQHVTTTVRTKKGLQDAMDMLKDLEAPAPETSKDPVSYLLELTEQIHAALEARAENTLLLGRLLSEAKEEFESSTDFVKWAEKACGIKRAQIFKWVRIYKTFGDETPFKGVAMRVLYALAGYSDQSPEYKDALVVVEAGETLDSARFEAIEAKHKPVSTPPKEPKLVELEEGNGSDDSDNGPDDVPFDLGGDTSSGTSEDPKEPQQPTIQPAPVPEQVNVLEEQVSQKDKLIESLQAQIQELTEALKQVRKPQSAPKMPALPQFDSACPFAVLGLSQTAKGNASEIKAAHRALAKLYSGQQDISDKLLKAREALLSQ